MTITVLKTWDFPGSRYEPSEEDYDPVDAKVPCGWCDELISFDEFGEVVCPYCGAINDVDYFIDQSCQKGETTTATAIVKLITKGVRHDPFFDGNS